MSDKVQVTFRIPEDVDDDIEDELEYGDSKAEWVREACEQKLDRERGELVAE